MNRRDFLRFAGAGGALAMTQGAGALAARPGADWRSFELRYEVELAGEGGPAALWLPLPMSAPGYQQALDRMWEGNAYEADFAVETEYGAPLFRARWEGDGPRRVAVTTIVQTRDRGMRTAGADAADDVRRYLEPTPSMPVDGIVGERARAITTGHEDPLDKARAIYEWIVDNTFREPTVKGCGLGDIRFMLESGNLGGKCADINSLFVGLARAAGIPAREKYGIRVAESQQFKSLGKAGDISKAQHCRAEFWLAGTGWIPVDPADVRKAVLEERLPLADPAVARLRERLFGYWEMNWVAFNHGRDFALAGDTRGLLPFFMYPQGRVASERRDSLDPQRFVYRISSREIA